MGFDDLPLETLHQIFGHFCLHCREIRQSTPPDAYLRGTRQDYEKPSWYSLDRHTLFSMCLVSKGFYHATQPVLYHEFILGYGDSWRSDLYTWDGRLTSFMRTVAQRRDLAALVKRVYIHPYLLESLPLEEEDYHGSACMPPSLSILPQPREYISEEEAQNTLREIAPISGIEEPERFSAGDLVTFLIAVLPNLEHCSLQVGPYKDEIVRSAGLRAVGISRLPIKTIDMPLRAWADTGSLFSIETRARALFEVSPYLETLNLHMCGGIWRQDPLPSLPNLKNLRLTFSLLGERDLEGLLSSCSGLRSFTYEATKGRFDRFTGQFNKVHFRLPSAVQHLSRHRSTLQSLHLDLRKRNHSMDGPDPRAIFSLREFTVLEHLFLNLDEFHSYFWAGSPEEDSELLVQLYPHSIKSLHLAGHIGDELHRLEKALLGLADAVLYEQFPRLEQVLWDKNQELNRDDAVRTMFSAAGVSFDYDSWPTTESTPGDGRGLPGPNYLDPFAPLPLPSDSDADL